MKCIKNSHHACNTLCFPHKKAIRFGRYHMFCDIDANGSLFCQSSADLRAVAASPLTILAVCVSCELKSKPPPRHASRNGRFHTLKWGDFRRDFAQRHGSCTPPESHPSSTSAENVVVLAGLREKRNKTGGAGRAKHGVKAVIPRKRARTFCGYDVFDTVEGHLFTEAVWYTWIPDGRWGSAKKIHSFCFAPIIFTSAPKPGTAR